MARPSLKDVSPGQLELVPQLVPDCPGSFTFLGTGPSTRDTIFIVPSEAPSACTYMCEYTTGSTRIQTHDPWIMSSIP